MTRNMPISEYIVPIVNLPPDLVVKVGLVALAPTLIIALDFLVALPTQLNLHYISPL